MSEHTPGPWLVDGPAIRSKHVSIATVLDVAWPYGNRPNNPGANARLIAAAPELLEALKLCEGNISSLLASQHPKVFGTWLEVVHSAIAKATGGQP